MSEYRCPRCKSKDIRTGYPDILCYKCGYSEPLIDYPISWDWHRHYCREYGKPDPGPCYPLKDEILERIGELEKRIESISALPAGDKEKLNFQYLRDEIDQLKASIRYTQRLIPKSKPEKKPAQHDEGIILC